MQIVWGLRKEPFIGVRPLNHAKEAPSTGAWQFTNAIDSWSWQGYEGEKAVVEVYPASICCNLYSGIMAHIGNGISKKNMPYITEEDGQQIVVATNKTRIVYKFF